MGRFSCFGGKIAGIIRSRNQGKRDEAESSSAAGIQSGPPGTPEATGNTQNIPPTFTFRQLQTATKNFRTDKRIGEGGSAHVFKGKLRTGQIVAVKKLKPVSTRNMNYDLEVRMLSRLSHPNIIEMIGCCAEGVERIIVYEFMPWGSLYGQLHARKTGEQPLDWNARMKIAGGVAKALNYLHKEANPPVIYRDLKPSNILLGNGFHPKLSDFGIAKSATISDVTSGIMGTPPYWSPEHALAERLSFKSDVYSFGVVLLEIIAGNVPLDKTYGHYVADWVMIEKNFVKVADRELKGQFPEDMLKKAMKVVTRCINVRPNSRPDMSDVVRAMDYLTAEPNAADWPVEFFSTVEGEREGEPSSSNQERANSF